MKNWNVALFALAAFASVLTGCAKKSTEQASINGTGFDSMSSTDELAQLPQNSTASQQASVEALPVETSPITQGVPPIAGPTSNNVSGLSNNPPGEDAGSSTREQQIQTALKNAGLYQGAVDGKIGPGTKRAIIAFQTAHHLKADGKVGTKTWAALEPYLLGVPQSVSATNVDQ
jgi:peptidoglycan hydrolase-like protein with peptidoglycan-binding domain